MRNGTTVQYWVRKNNSGVWDVMSGKLELKLTAKTNRSRCAMRIASRLMDQTLRARAEAISL